MDQIRESLGRIAELSEEELKSLEDSVLSEYASVKDQDPSPEVVDTLKELAIAAKAVKEEKAGRAAQAEQLAAEASEAVSEIEALTAKEDEEVDETTDEILDEQADPEVESDELEPETVTEDALPVEEEDEEDKKKNAFATEEPEAGTLEVDGAIELSNIETPEQPAEPVTEFTANETELATDKDAKEEVKDDEEEKKDFSTEEPTTETEASVEEPTTETEAAVEEPTTETEAAVEEPTNIEAATEEFAAEQTESAEETVTASNTPNPEAHETPAVSPVTITAGADLPGITAGAKLPDMKAVAQAMLDRKKGMGRTTGGDGEQALVASFKTSYPENRYLDANDVEGNRAKINEIVSSEAIVAAGGLTAPVETVYDIYGLGETAVRPVKDSLAVFGADRGGIRYLTPPVMADLEGSVSTWTLQDDIDAADDTTAGPVKPCLRVESGEEKTVYTDAIPLCLTFGNLGARAYPELVERHTELAMVWHARYAETRILTRIGALSTSVSATAQLGAARDIFVQVDTAAAAFRSRYRLDPKAPMRAMFPEWFKNALRADLVKQLPGDGQEAAFNLAENQITAWFRSRNIDVTWFLDGEEGQIFGAQAAGALLDFPDNVVWYLFPEGTFLFLDGGILDLGLVRDSTLNGTNDYKVFLETFEGVAKVGVESLRITSGLKIAGASAATVDTIA